MPELNKLQNQQLEIKGCAACDPIPPAVDLCSKHSSIVHTLSHFLKYIFTTYLSKLLELRVLTLLRRIENDFAHTKNEEQKLKTGIKECLSFLLMYDNYSQAVGEIFLKILVSLW